MTEKISENNNNKSKLNTFFIWCFCIGICLHYINVYMNKLALENVNREYPFNNIEIFIQSIGAGIGFWLIAFFIRCLWHVCVALVRKLPSIDFRTRKRKALELTASTKQPLLLTLKIFAGIALLVIVIGLGAAFIFGKAVVRSINKTTTERVIENVQKDFELKLQYGIENIVDAYKSGGINNTINIIENCYALVATESSKKFCFQSDVAGMTLSRIDFKLYGKPQPKFYTENEFRDRFSINILPYFKDKTIAEIERYAESEIEYVGNKLKESLDKNQ